MNNNCVICLNDIKTEKSRTILSKQFETDCKCNIYYHNRCIKRWWNKKYGVMKCPICRKDVFSGYVDKKTRQYFSFFA